MSTIERAALSLSLASLFAIACAEESLSPVATDAPTSTPTPTSTGGGGSSETPPTPTKVRDVSYRNPFGEVPDNLLADGDFELSISSSDGQYGWFGFSPSGNPLALDAETGGLCRTGLRCARVQKGNGLFARGTAAPDGAEHRVSIWMKPAGEGASADGSMPCELADVYVIGCDSFNVLGGLEPVASPDASGWCEINGVANPSKRALCLYVEIGEQEVLVDSATLLPLEPSANRTKVSRQPRPEQRARMEIVRERIRQRMMFGSGAPSRDPRLQPER